MEIRDLTISQVSEQLVVDEPDQGGIELQESGHDLVIDIERQPLVELVRSDPGNVLSHNLNLVVNTLDGVEGFFEALGDCAVSHEVFDQLAACCDFLLGDLESLMLGETCEQTQKAHCII